MGLWFVPVALCILVPLALLCGWAIMQFSKKMTKKIEHIEKSAKKERDDSIVDGLKAHPTT